MSGLDHRLEPEGEFRRFEIINGAMGRRRWSADDRARILEETLTPGAVVSAVARRHGLTPQQLFRWRREARKRLEAETAPAFVPAIVVAPEPIAAKGPQPRAKRRAPVVETMNRSPRNCGHPVRQTHGRPRKRPAKLHADKGYDFNRCRRDLRARSITPRIARRGVESSSYLGKHRWVVERTFAWISQFRRLIICYERHADLYRAFLVIAAAIICFRAAKRFC